MFSCEYCEIFKNTYFGKHLRTAASGDSVDFTYIAGLDWSLVEEKVDFMIIKLVCSGLNRKSIPLNLQLKIATEKENIIKKFTDANV